MSARFALRFLAFDLITLVSITIAGAAIPAAAATVFQDDFQSGLDLTRWAQHTAGGGTWIWAEEDGNGYVTSPAQPYPSYDLGRQDHITTIENDFTDFVMTWDWRMRSSGYDQDQRGIYLRAQGVDRDNPYGYWILACAGCPGAGNILVLGVWEPEDTWGDVVQMAFPWEIGAWYHMKALVSGNQFKVKAWRDGDPEPASWTLECEDSRHVYAQGAVGFWDYMRGVTDADNVVVTSFATNRVEATAPATAITAANPCVRVPVTIAREDATPLRGFSVTVQLSPELVSCGTGIAEGSYLGDAGTTTFQVTANGGGSYTVDGTILGLPCGATAPSGTLFTLDLGSPVATGTGTVAVTSVKLRDCANAEVASVAGPPLSVMIDKETPTAVALRAVQRTSNNNADGITKMDLSWTGAVTPGDSVLIYRAGYGHYPEYDMGGADPGTPAFPPAPPWELAGIVVDRATFSDESEARDFWYYVAFVKDPAGTVGPASNRTAGTLNYFLGDVHNGGQDCRGNNRVFLEDISFLGSHYGIALGDPDALACLDVGPTTDGSVNGRPVPDDRVDFEDLMLFSVNYRQVSAPQANAVPVAAQGDALRIEVPEQVAAGETFPVTLRMSGAGDAHGLSVQLAWDKAVAEPVAVEAGPLIASQGGVVLSSAPGTVDAVLLGAGNAITGDGIVATVQFRARAQGAPRVRLARADVRDAANHPIQLAGVEGGTPLATTLAPAVPNPFDRGTVLAVSLARPGPMELAIYSVDGRRVARLASGPRAAGLYRLSWDGRDEAGAPASPGMYFARLVTAQGRFTRTLVLIR